MTWDLFWELAKQFGLPVSVAIFVLWASMSGRFRWDREFKEAEKDTATLRQDYERQLAEITSDRNYWRDTAVDLLQRYDRATGTSEAAVGAAVRAISRRRD